MVAQILFGHAKFLEIQNELYEFDCFVNHDKKNCLQSLQNIYKMSVLKLYSRHGIKSSRTCVDEQVQII